MANGLVRRAAVLGACAVMTVVACPAASAGTPTCAQWTAETVASGYLPLENLGFDGRGGMLLSETSPLGPGGALQRLGADGSRTTAVPDVSGPGGITVSGSTAYFTTGNLPTSGFLGVRDGTVAALDLDTGAVSTVATGLVMPNGLARLPDGEFVVSRNVGADTGVTRAPADGSPATPYPAPVSSANGLAMDGGRLYVASTFTPTSTISAVNVRDPAREPDRLELDGIGPLNSADDLTVGPDGALYVALNVAGEVARVDPATGGSCTIADALPLTSSVRFGAGPGWDPNALYATSFLGTVTKLTPPGP